MVAREELKLLEHSERSINLKMALAFPEWTFEAIKRLSKNPAYRGMCDGLRRPSGGNEAKGGMAGDVTTRQVSCVNPSAAGGETRSLYTRKCGGSTRGSCQDVSHGYTSFVAFSRRD